MVSFPWFEVEGEPGPASAPPGTLVIT
jgi:hypothetical protein